MHKELCGWCHGTGERMVFDNDDWDKYLKWRRATDRQFVIDENTHGKGFVAVSVEQMENTYDEWGGA